MHIKEIFGKKTVFSFEVFPPKKTSPVEVITILLTSFRDFPPISSALLSVRAEAETAGTLWR